MQTERAQFALARGQQFLYRIDIDPKTKHRSRPELIDDEPTIRAFLDGEFGRSPVQRSRHQPWTETYQLYRDTVITNRLTQRQSVNVPLMKATIRTLLSRAKDPADLEFEDYENNGMRELLMNSYIDKVLEENKYGGRSRRARPSFLAQAKMPEKPGALSSSAKVKIAREAIGCGISR